MGLFDRFFSRQQNIVVEPNELLDRVGVSDFVGALEETQREKLRETLWNKFEFDKPSGVGYDYEKLGIPGRFDLFRQWTWIERLEILERAHFAWERNPLANSAVSYTTQFAVGEGGKFTYYADEVKGVLEEFVNDPDNHFHEYEKEFCDSLQVDGELFVRFFYNAQGRVTIVPIPPYFVQWIEVDPEFYKRVVSYHYQPSFFLDQPGVYSNRTEDIPADEIIHATINKMPYELRGRSELFRVLPWLRAYKEWLEDRARINKRKGAVLFDVTLKNATPGQVTSKRSQYAKPPTSGSLIIHNENEVWQILGARIEAGDAAEDGRQFKLMVAAGLREPEFYFADGANANLASSKSQSMPVIRKFVNFQDILTEQIWVPIFKQVIKKSVEIGRIPEMVPALDRLGEPVMEEPKASEIVIHAMRDIRAGKLKEAFDALAGLAQGGSKQKMIKAEDAFSYGYPKLEKDDPATLLQVYAFALDRGLASEETAAEELGFDPAQEAERLARGKQRKAVEMAATGGPTVHPSGGVPVGQPGDIEHSEEKTLAEPLSSPSYAGN